MRIAPPSLPPHHSGPATRDFQSSISVEALFHRCHLDVQGLLHQQLLSSAMVQYGGLLPVDRVVVLPCMFRYSWLLHHPPLAGISVFLQPRLQSPFGLSDVDLAAAAGDTIYNIGLFTRRQCILHFGQYRMETVRPDLKTTLMLNFLQTHLMSSLIPAT